MPTCQAVFANVAFGFANSTFGFVNGETLHLWVNYCKFILLKLTRHDHNNPTYLPSKR